MWPCQTGRHPLPFDSESTGAPSVLRVAGACRKRREVRGSRRVIALFGTMLVVASALSGGSASIAGPVQRGPVVSWAGTHRAPAGSHHPTGAAAAFLARGYLTPEPG